VVRSEGGGTVGGGAVGGWWCGDPAGAANGTGGAPASEVLRSKGVASEVVALE